MDNRIDESDITYVEGVIKGTNAPTNLSDANYDGKIDSHDLDQITKIMRGEEEELTIVDSYNRTVTVQEPVGRIISFYAPIVESMRSLNARDNIVGVTEHVIENKAYYPEFDNSTSVGLGPSHGEPDIERVLELKPDVVFANTYIKNVVLVDLIKSVDLDIELFSWIVTNLRRIWKQSRSLGMFLGGIKKPMNLLISIKMCGAQLMNESKPSPTIRGRRYILNSTNLMSALANQVGTHRRSRLREAGIFSPMFLVKGPLM